MEGGGGPLIDKVKLCKHSDFKNNPISYTWECRCFYDDSSIINSNKLFNQGLYDTYTPMLRYIGTVDGDDMTLYLHATSRDGAPDPPDKLVRKVRLIRIK